MADGSETIEMLIADGLQLNTINKHKIYRYKRSTKIFLDINLKRPYNLSGKHQAGFVQNLKFNINITVERLKEQPIL